MALSNSISAVTKEHFLPILVDNIFNSNALCLKLLKNAEKVDGGVKINVPVEYAQNGNSGWITPGTGQVGHDGSSGSNLGQAITDTFQKATYDWATAYNSVVIASDEAHINQGANAVLSILKAKMKNAEKTIKDLFGTGMFAAAQADDGLVTLNGAGTLAAGDYTGSDNGVGIIEDLGSDTTVYHAPGNVDNAIIGYRRSLGGINSDTATWWNAKLGHFGLSGGTVAVADLDAAADDMTFSNFTDTDGGVAKGVKAMTRMYGACSVDADQPDLIVTTQTIYDAYESSLQANKRFESNTELADAGFQTLAFKGASVVVDSHCPAGQMYFLNTKYLGFKVHSKRFFSMEDFKSLEAMDSIQARIFWMGQLCCSNPSRQGVMVGGPTGY